MFTMPDLRYSHSRPREPNNWVPLSQISHNVNSLGATNAGGIADRFAKILTLICFLLNSADVVHLQDIRIPTDNFISCLGNTMPNYTFSASANNTNSAGVVTIFKNDIAKDYDVSHEIIHSGYILSTTFDHRFSNNSFTTINTYLHASSSTAWENQINILNERQHKHNTIILGDFNHAQDNLDRSGYHKDKTTAAIDTFKGFIDSHNFQEIHQHHHTFYKKDNNRLISSRIDLAFHNFDLTNVALYSPSAKIITTAPHTVTKYNKLKKINNWSNMWNGNDDALDDVDPQVISDFVTVAEGGSHVTDHLPLVLRFKPIAHSTTPPKFNTNALNNTEYAKKVEEIWHGSFHTGDWRHDLDDLTYTVTKASYLLKNNNKQKSKNGEIRDAIRLVAAIDNNDTEIDTKFSHIPDYLDLKNNHNLLIDKINTELAAEAYDKHSFAPLSKIQTIAKTLPSARKHITQLYDSFTDAITDDPVTMTNIAHRCWGGKWSRKTIHNPDKLFSIYGKKIRINPKNIDLDFIIDIINNTNDSAPGPDGVPFAAYRAIPELAAKVFAAAIEGMMSGSKPSKNFNAGILHLLPKKDTDRIEDTRPLVINNTNNRIIATVIQRSINDSIESILSDNQNGFRDHRNTATNIEFFNEKFYSALEHHRFYDIIFIDFLKAFDSVSHEAIFHLLSAIGMPVPYINIIRALFHNAHCYTNFKGAEPAKIFFHSGVKQGCPLSPTLFILIIDVLLDMLESIKGLSPKFFADDGAIGSKNIIPKLHTIKNFFDIFKRCTGLEMNVAKSAVIATGGRTDLRRALDAINWNELPISGNERYLGTYIGHKTTLDDIFKGPFDKFHKRLKLYSSHKSKYSLQTRVIIWNTWLLTIFSYVFKFHTIPTDYLGWIDSLCVDWLGVGTYMKSLHLARPKKLLGLNNPLKDTTIYNYSLLASNSEGIHHDPNSFVWSIRSSTHRRMAKEFLQEEYNLNLHTNFPSSTIYHNATTSSTFTINCTNYLKDKFNNINIPDTHHRNILRNYALSPNWLPSYVRESFVKLTHNALPTDRRMKISSSCYLCNEGEDSIHHMHSDCAAVKQAHTDFWHALRHQRHYSFSHAVCSDEQVEPHISGAQLMINDSVWRARCNARAGLEKCISGWAYWICDNTITRISNINPSFFDSNYNNNHIPLRYKISYKTSLGSSKHNNHSTRKTAQQVIASHIAKLPIGSIYAFTDGSAKPNPGPTGAGIAIYRRAMQEDELISTYSFAVGQVDNNAGELFAIGATAEHCNNLNLNSTLTIYTDSNLARGALDEGWSIGRNFPLLHKVRQALRDLGSNYNIKWVPGHSDIPQNEVADELADAGAVAATDYPLTLTDICSLIDNQGFLAFPTT